ncbi:metallophosphoesterase [Actinoplanes sp. L3-i22]|uniref:metallophosphoesterase family protein n=1 Tax=Actinoplanes sp. L3-i22 TaxID=2836373 RepID=UPI001C7435D6|nr:metallophosphoesterase [Actinoplanes sp. L3-i22]BCY10438.1 phosphohydrolase [Actinoplanes sp. L3-i22]
MRILHLSDTHLTREPGPAHETLRQLLRDCADIPDVDVVVVTGDVADDGSPEAYRAAREIIGRPAIFAAGNHDDRAAFAAVLGSGHENPVSELRSAGGERAAVSVIGGYRIITLDSVVPGRSYGRISRTQLSWLDDVLIGPSVLAFHHPPVAVPGMLAQAAMGLRDPGELAETIAGREVRLMLCGHFHSQAYGVLANTPVWVTPGVASRVDLTAPPDTVRYVTGASASVIDVDGPTIHTVHARDPEAGRLIGQVGPERLAEVIATQQT